MVNGEAGKGCRYRPYSPKAWDKAWLRIWGKKCDNCKGKGYIENDEKVIVCNRCNGNGYLERKRR